MNLVYRRRADGHGLARPGRGRNAAARRRGRRPCLEPLESRRLLSNTSITDFPTPTAAAGPTWITSGPDGNLWFTEFSADKVGLINPTSHATTDFLLPTAAAGPEDITAGPDGNLWFTEYSGNKIGTINPTTHVITEFALPTAGAEPYGIAAGPDGNLWFTEYGGNKIGTINPTTHVITEFAVPTAGSEPLGIAAGPDGNLWFTEYSGNKIGTINPTTHVITEYSLPTAGSNPFSIAAGADGNLWFTEYGISKIGTINPTTHVINEFATPTATTNPIGIASGGNGNLWFTEPSADQIGTINPITHGIAEFAIPTATSDPFGIAAGPDGNLWFDEYSASKIGVASPATYVSVTTEPPSFVEPGNAFGLTVSVHYYSGPTDTGYNGPVTVALLNPGTATLSGTLTVTAKDGVATFTGLSINQVGTGYQLMAYTDALTTTLTTPVTIDVAPTIVAETILYAGKGRHKHIVGFELTFSKALADTPAQDVANYTVTQTVRLHGKPSARAVALMSAAYDATTDAVTLTIAGKAAFLTGGMIVVNASSPNGITDLLGDELDGTGMGVPGVNATLVISPKGRGITLMS
jgi:streptogramin lyase